MAKLLVLITPQIEKGHHIGQMWQEAGAPGVTFVEGYGLQQLRTAEESIEVLPGTTSMLEILRQSNIASLIVLSVVEDAALVERLINVVETVLGNLYDPNKGIVFTLDVERAVGIRRHQM